MGDTESPTGDSTSSSGDSSPDDQDVDNQNSSSGDSSPDEQDVDSQTPLCQVLCQELDWNCSEFGPYGTDQTSCVVACEELAAVSLDSLVAMYCLIDTCEPSVCDPGDTPFPIPPSCDMACALLDGCDMVDLVEPDYPDLLELCSLGCAAGFVTGPDFVPGIVECITDELATGCDPEVVEMCFGEGPGEQDGLPTCPEVCDMAMNFTCMPWEDGPSEWAAEGACMADCEDFEVHDEASAITMYGCAITASCDALAHCTAPPPSGDDPSCEALCVKVFGQCGGDFMPSESFCTDYCTGQLMIYGASVTAQEAITCMEANPVSCDEDPYNAMFGCLLSLEDECDTICEAMAACQGGTVDECLEPCNAGLLALFSSSTTAELSQCIIEAAGDCTAEQACLSGPAPPPCYIVCSSGQACEPNEEMCQAACDTKVTDGALADVACEYADKCQTPGMCEGLDLDTPPMECVDACAGAPETTCADYPGGCVAACQGLFIGSGGADPTLPYCVAPALGESCSLDAAYWNCIEGP